MKKGFLTFLALFSLAVLFMAAGTAMAEPVNGTYYNTKVYDAAGTASTVVYGNVFRVSPGTKKTIGFYGYSSSTTAVPATGSISRRS